MRIPIALGLSSLAMLSTACSGAAHGTSASTGSGAGDTGTNSGSSTGGGGAATSFPEAPHPPLPQVKDFGGPVLATPTIVAVTFPGDAYATQLDDFAGKLGATSYWTHDMAEYGVGPVKLRSAVHLTTNPFVGTVDDTAIQAWLAQEIGGGSLPPADGSTIYTLFFLDTQTVTHAGATSCQQFAGYHEEAPLPGGGAAPYVIVARCPSASNGLTGVAQVTAAASHELAEASTDPFPDTKPAYQEVEPSEFGWEIAVGGGEIADMCETAADAFFTPPGFAYVVQRTWSNAAATAGHDPCVPAPAGPYFNSAAVLPDMISLSLVENGTPTQVSVIGVSIPVGSSKAIELDLFSDTATSGPWTVSASDFTVPPQAPILSFSFDQTTGQNGDKLHLTITPLTGTFTNTESFVVESKLGGATNAWEGLIGN